MRFVTSHFPIAFTIRDLQTSPFQWGDIEFEKKTLAVNRQKSTKGLGPPKTSSSLKTIYLDDVTIVILKEYKQWQDDNKEENLHYIVSVYVMVNETGREFHYSQPQYLMMMMLLKIAGLPTRQSTHLLRHTHAVLLLEAGVDIKTVSRRLGYKNIQIISNVYLHVSDNHERNSM